MLLDSDDYLFNVVLVEPEIPQNTGNIGRICVGVCSRLHLVGPVGFDLSDKRVKRAGLDYWPHLTWFQHRDWKAWWQQMPDSQTLHFFSTKAQKSLYKLKFKQGDWLVFGSETKGLGPKVTERYSSKLVRIPSSGHIRSFNLANAVSMVLGEGMRQWLSHK